MKKNNLTKKIISFFNGRQKFYDKQMMHPTREWLLGLLFFTVVVISGSIISAHTFLTYLHIKTNEGEFTEEITKYNKALVTTALNLYEQRKTDFNELQESGMVEIVVLEEEATTTESVVSDEVELGVVSELELEPESETPSNVVSE